MTNHDAERLLELEEAAEGVEVFRTPGNELGLEKARDQAEASGWIPERDQAPSPRAGRLETIRGRRDALRVAMHSLETIVAGPASSPAWRDLVGNALSAIRVALDNHVAAVESPDGLLEEILDIAPRLAPLTEEIEADHRDLVRVLQRAEDAIPGDFDSRTVRRTAMSLLAALAIHRQRGSDLIYEAYSVDIGTGF